MLPHLDGLTALWLVAGDPQAWRASRVTVTADPRLLASYTDSGWIQAAGIYDIWVSPSAKLSGLHGTAQLTRIKANSVTR